MASGRTRILLALMGCLGPVALLSLLPALDTSIPLPWDMAHHLLGAQQVAQGLSEAEFRSAATALLESDLYPPLHSLLLGACIAVFGDMGTTVFNTGVVALVGMALAWIVGIFDRRHAAVTASCLLVAISGLAINAYWLAYSRTTMVEPLSVLTVLAAIVASSRLLERPSPVGFALATVATTAALLTKYNTGLALIPAIGLTGLIHARSNWLAAATLVASAATGLLLLALFLWIQEDGLHNFLTFVRNRSSEGVEGPTARMGHYWQLYTTRYVPGLFWAVLILGFATLAQWSRSPRVRLLTLYTVTTLFALSFHGYTLDRNLITASVTMSTLAALGVVALASRSRSFTPLRAATAGVVITAAMLIAASGSFASALGIRAEILPANRLALAAVDDFIWRSTQASGRVRIIGTFNELSPAWLRTSSSRKASPPSLRFDFPYPRLATDRTRRDASPDVAYRIEVDRWLQRDPDPVVVALEVKAGSTFWTDDYDRWSAWKNNYVRALEQSLDLVSVTRRNYPSLGLTIHVFKPTRKPAIRFAQGWGPGEHWGRWAILEEATLDVNVTELDSRLLLRAATFEGLDVPQRVQVYVDDTQLDEFVVRGRPWEFQDHFIPAIEMGTGRHRIALRFSVLRPGNEGDATLRALPFESIRLIRTNATEQLPSPGR